MKKTAIILFADLPEFEAKTKKLSLFSVQHATREISSFLTQHFHQLAKQTTAETFLIDTFSQNGNSFGERISNAFDAVYAKGFENVICIGNDCPELSLAQLQASIFEVEAGRVVLGPTIDGGAYLIGIPKNSFNHHNFQNINWNNARNFNDLCNLFDQQYITLALLSDLDNVKDFSFLDFKNEFVKILQTILKEFRISFFTIINTIQHPSFCVNRLFLKGPPSLFI